jgi:hypothetical protein
MSVRRPAEASPNRAWDEIAREALWNLEHADELQPRESTRGMARLLRVWRYPRSGPHVSWSVILPAREYRSRRSVIREVAWDRLKDWKRSHSAQQALKRRQTFPATLRFREAELDWDELSPCMDGLGGLWWRMPVQAAPDLREDEFGLEGYRSLTHVKLQWRGKGPRGWGEVVSRVARLRDLLARCMRDRETQRSGD